MAFYEEVWFRNEWLERLRRKCNPGLVAILSYPQISNELFGYDPKRPVLDILIYAPYLRRPLAGFEGRDGLYAGRGIPLERVKNLIDDERIQEVSARKPNTPFRY